MSQTGALILLTGFSGAGKSELARALGARWLARGGAPLVVIDGDEARQALSPELGFSKADRNMNVARMGYVGAMVALGGGVCCVAAIAPYRQARESVRRAAHQNGSRFLLAHVSTELAVCRARDPKGLYAKHAQGGLHGLTGVDDPYETPEADEAPMRLDMGRGSAAEGALALERWLLGDA